MPREPASPLMLSAWTPAPLASIVALWLVVAGNYSFWTTLTGGLGDSTRGVAAALTLAVALWASLTFALHLLAFTRLHRWLWAIVLVASAAAAHFVDHWGVLIDKAMLRNVVQTDTAEALDLLTSELVLDLLFRGLLPAAAILAWPMQRPRLKSSLIASVSLALLGAGLFTAALAVHYSEYAPTFRNHRELRYQLVPANFVRAGVGIALPTGHPSMRKIEPVAQDATRTPGAQPLLFVLVVGETARADNFSLGDYARPTNAALSSSGVRYFQGVKSCGTDTATSLPCMFTDIKGDAYSVEQAGRRENLLDILQRTGVNVAWVENNSGCKGVCDRVPTTRLQDLDACAGRDCNDADFALAIDRLPRLQADTLMVFHQQGSHGPAYFKRYPGTPAFGPACETNRLQDCPRETVVNAYDSSIDFTSQALANVIRALERRAFQSAGGGVVMLYISDHGESLGERGVYLHGLPSWVAPHEQFHVPMMLWMDDAARRRLAPDTRCLDDAMTRDLSHDYLYHTLMGAFDVKSKVYVPRLDLLAGVDDVSRCPPKTTDFVEQHRTNQGTP